MSHKTSERQILKKYRSVEEFKRLVQSSVTAAEYLKLPETLDLPGAWFLRTMNNPAIMKRKTLKKLSSITGVTEFELMYGYGCGIDKQSAKDAIEILQSESRRIEKANVEA